MNPNLKNVHKFLIIKYSCSNNQFKELIPNMEFVINEKKTVFVTSTRTIMSLG